MPFSSKSDKLFPPSRLPVLQCISISEYQRKILQSPDHKMFLTIDFAYFSEMKNGFLGVTLCRYKACTKQDFVLNECHL